MAEAIQITGLREVQKKLYAYSRQLGDRVALSALRSGANLIRKKITTEIQDSGIQSRSGKLLKGFKVSRSKIHRGRLSTDMIGIYLTLRKGKDAPFYGKFLNDGYTSRGGKKIEGKRFVQKAFESNKESASRLIVLNATAGADVLARKVGL